MRGLMQFDYFGDAQRAGDHAEARKDQRGLRALAGEYYGQQDPMLGKVAALGGDAAGMQKDQMAMQDRKRQQLGQFAALLVKAPPQMRPGLYKQMHGQLAQIVPDAPPEYTPEIDGIAEQIAAQFGGAQGANTGIQSTFVDANGMRVGVTRDGRTVPLGQNAPQMQILEGQGGFYGVNKSNLQAAPVTMGAAPQGPQQPAAPAQGTNDGVIAVANQMAQAGIPPQFIEQWMAKQPGIQPVSQQEAPQAAPQPQAQQLQPAPKPKEPSALEQRIAVARSMGANDQQIQRMVLGGESGGGLDVKSEMALRKEYGDLIKEPLIVRRSFNKVSSAAQNDSAAGDLSMIFAYMKMLDPNSVVRETEFANAQNAAGVPDQVRNAWNRAMTGERLNPRQRADFVRQAELLATQAQEQIDGYKQYYGGLASEYGFSPERVAFDPFAPTKPQQGGGSAPTANAPKRLKYNPATGRLE